MNRPTLFDRWTLLILLASGGWMFWAAGHYTVFDDEAFSCQRYVLPPGEMVRGLWNGVEPDPPLYYILENLSVRLLGVGPLGLRSLSIVLFLIGLVFMRAVATEAWGYRAGISTMALCAIHPAHLFFGFAARWYSAMFLVVAVLLFITRRLIEADRSTVRIYAILWAITAAGVLYTNYFGVVVVAMIWLAAVIRIGDRKRLMAAGLFAALLFVPWFPPFWRQATAFPRFSGSAGSMLATAARTTMALLAGDLASPRAWWVWGPMAVFAVLLVTLLIQNWKRMALLTLVVAGCFIAGVISRTMIDKYVMTFSGIFCLWLARLLCSTPEGGNGKRQRLRISTITALTFAWLGCGYNLVTERNWSSLRWLDPFPTAMRAAFQFGAPDNAVFMTHPAAEYYRGLIHDRRVAPEERPTNRVTIEAAEYADSPEWSKLRTVLDRDYRLVDELRYLEDPDAAWKDRLDPQFRHPRWRIVVRYWRLK